MAKKAGGAPPWTKKKLNRYRERQRELIEEQREAEKRQARDLAKSGSYVDKTMKGCE